MVFFWLFAFITNISTWWIDDNMKKKQIFEDKTILKYFLYICQYNPFHIDFCKIDFVQSF
jgi:hypothetical protein